MKKVGIVTFHRAMNCGAMLQAYALQEVLNRKFDTFILDYRCEELERVYNYKRSLKGYIRFFARFFLKHGTCSQEIGRSDLFIQFSNNYFRKSKKYTIKNVYKANNEFDFFIAGSDQIWNPKWSKADWNYFLDFADNYKKYSYAASFGGDKVEEQYKSKIASSLSTFQSILVREESGLGILESLGIKNDHIGAVCDPVLLLSREEWLSQFDLRTGNKGYIFLYFAASQTNSVEFAKKIAKETGKKVIYYNSFGTKNIDDSFENLIKAGPIEFLSLIYNADLVITTSFHALAFSLIFNTPFVYELNKKKNNNNSRLENLASICDVEARKLDSVETFEFETINWNKVNERINNYRTESERFLFKCLPDSECGKDQIY